MISGMFEGAGVGRVKEGNIDCREAPGDAGRGETGLHSVPNRRQEGQKVLAQ